MRLARHYVLIAEQFEQTVSDYGLLAVVDVGIPSPADPLIPLAVGLVETDSMVFGRATITVVEPEQMFDSRRGDYLKTIGYPVDAPAALYHVFVTHPEPVVPEGVSVASDLASALTITVAVTTS